MKRTLLFTGLSLLFSHSLFADSIEEIAKRHAAATAAEIEAYLEDNPNAPDKNGAYSHLLKSYHTTGDTDKSIGVFQQRFDALESGEKTNTRLLYSNTSSLFNLFLKAKRNDEAIAVIAAAIVKVKGHPEEDDLTDAFKQMGAKLTKPDTGGSLEIKFTSLQGEEIDLAAMKDKIVLVDFWATWCGPCIAELPHMKETYEKYHEKGFEIIGISLDQISDKEKLQDFIKKKEMPWPQHFEEEKNTNRFAIKYGITSIPSTFLIGKDGKIIATNLRGPALEEAVAKHIGE